MTFITPPPINDGIALDLELTVNPEDCSIYLKIKGFTNIEEAEEYSEYLGNTLPLLLFESDVKH